MNWTWLYMSLEIAAFLALSAVMFFVITRADTEPEVSDADRVAPVTVTDVSITTPAHPSGYLVGQGPAPARDHRAA
jgi:hypothetical protein